MPIRHLEALRVTTVLALTLASVACTPRAGSAPAQAPTPAGSGPEVGNTSRSSGASAAPPATSAAGAPGTPTTSTVAAGTRAAAADHSSQAPDTAAAGSNGHAGASAASGNGGDGAPVAAAPGNAPDAWLLMGYDLKNWYFNPAEVTLSPSNATRLVELWRVKVSPMPSGSPVIAAGKVFTMAPTGTYALDLATGKQLWSRTDLGGTASLAYDGGYLYLQTLVPARLYKLDAENGKTVWGPSEPFDPDIASGMSSPIVAAGMVLVGHENGIAELSLDPTSRALTHGGVEAYDAGSGMKLWTYYTTPPGGAENGASVWSSVAVDLSTRTVYATTGNNFTVLGPNSDAFHAIDLMTGGKRWHKQVRSGDLAYLTTSDPQQDTDFGANPILLDVGERHIVAAGDKAGSFWALDRDTGEILWRRDRLSPSKLASEHGGIFVNGACDGRYFYVVSNTEQPGGVLHKLDPLKQGESVWMHTFDALTWSALSLANGLLLAPVDTKLYVMDAKTGDVLKVFETGGTIAGGAAAIAQGRIVVKSGMIYTTPAAIPNDEVICYGLPAEN